MQDKIKQENPAAALSSNAGLFFDSYVVLIGFRIG
jgi:hypothetical protein